jgi:uroporphyrinogen-III decarboxylase
MMIAPALFDDLIAPCYTTLFDWVHDNTPWKVWFHSCGGIYPIIDALIECGVDILNPVQTSAAGMGPARLKAEFGERVTFWGGGIETQSVLPFGSELDVREQVRERLRIFGPGGGFVFATVHNIQRDVPAENILAMIETVHEYGRYPL